MITYRGNDLRKVSSDMIVAKGIAQVPEGRGIFGNLTVQENLKLATWKRKDKEIERDYEKIYKIFPRLKERRAQRGGRFPAENSRCGLLPALLCTQVIFWMSPRWVWLGAGA